MRLENIELKGFKSFANRTKIDFDDRITAVVGPNGSGKSNISDAIRWVLGEQSAKSLRGNKMDDVIFQGGENSKSLNLAEVNLNFSNEDKALDLAYDKVKISRRIYRDGENEYRINGKKVRLKDVRELFLDTGVGKEGYSIISQGRIEQIISSSPKDRRSIFEEASGISKHKFRRDEANKKLEKVSEDLEIINRDWEFKKKDLNLIKTYADNSRKHKELTESLDEKSYFYIKNKSESLIAEKSSVEDEINRLKSEIEGKSNKLDEIKSKLKPYEINLNSVNDEIYKATESIRRYEKSIEKSENSLLLNEREFSYKQKDLDRLLENIKNNNLKKEKLLKDLEDSKKRQKSLEEKLDEIKAQITDNKELSNKLEQDKIAISDNKKRVELDLVKISEEIYQYEINQKSKAILDKRKAKEDEIRIEKLNNLSKEIEKLEFDRDSLIKEIKTLEEKNANFKEELIKKSEILKDKKIKLDELIKENNENNLKLKTSISEFKLQKENLDKNRGYFYSIQDFLNKTKDSGLDNLYLDSLANLISVKEGYEEVIDNLMGNALQNIVTKSKSDTRELINFVNQNRLGRITFLPIDSIKSFRKDKPNYPEVLAMAYDLVGYKANLNHIIDHFLGSTVVVKDIDDAISLSNKIKGYRIITMNLDIINNWGSMVAGNDKNRKKNTNLLNRNKRLDDLKEKILKLRNNKDKLNLAYNELIQSIDDLEEKLTLDKKNFTNHVEDYRASLSKLATIKIKLENLYQRKEELNEKNDTDDKDEKIVDISDLKRKRDIANDKISEIGKELDEIDQLIKEKSTENLRLESQFEISKRDNVLTINKLSDLENAINDLESSSRLESKLKIETENSLKDLKNDDEKLRKTIDFSKKNMSKEKEKLSKKEISRNKMLDDNTTMVKDNTKLKEELKNLEMKKVEADYKLKSLKEKYDSLIDEVKAYISMPIEELSKKYKDRNIVKVSKSKLIEIQRKLNSVGYFESDSINKYEESKKEFDFIDRQLQDLVNSKDDIEKMIAKLEKDMKVEFLKNFKLINDKFTRIFKTLFIGGDAKLVLDSDDSLNAGIEIQARPPGKSQKTISLLSGGEKALTAVSLLFAIFETNPAPFAILDEIDAALDETNIKRYIEYLKSLSDKTQFIMITHRQTTMQLAERIHGVTISDEGISKIYSIDFGQN
ncbi:chromosome segregation protein SMC [Anaerococcus vaginimassiliensis]|uniref:chromosome segregation protein SMC n=1 Tax=Anaerococcus vaginimassiliensis TaxID=2042308 RepID=UPI00102F8004|nr:chromosome segregation protein SMC [Anaerococcus vaginimassiliensis]